VTQSALASSSVPRHLVRGAAGLLAFVGAFALLATAGAVGLLLLPVAVLAWRGCPTCWAIGLMETRRLGCPDGSCAPRP